ncbi:MAG TPA: ABC transporter substrate-binding protein [Ilumatobacteraceae bacterium]
MKGSNTRGHDQRSKQARRLLPVLLIGGALIASACSSSSKSATTQAPTTTTTAATTASTAAPATTPATSTAASTGTTPATTPVTTPATDAPTTTAAAADPLGTPKAATGDPLTIGYVYDGVSDVVDRSEELVSAQAAAKYINDYLGGVAGRPITLDVCETKSTPAGAADCVTKMVTDKVPVVVNGLTNVPGALYPPLAKAGIAVFSGGALDADSLTTPGIYLMGNALLTVLAGPAAVAAENNITQAAVAVVDNPAASGAIEQEAPLFYGNVKVGVDVVAIPADAPDVSPQITAELTKNPGLFQVIGDPPFCGKVMQALDSAGYTGKIVIIPNCLEGGANTDLPNLAGSIELGTNSTDTTGPEVALYEAVLAKYAASKVDTFAGGPLNGFQAMVGFARATAALTGDVTAASIEAAIEAMPATPYPIADGLTFQCNKKQVTIAPNICTNASLQTTLDAKGNGTTYSVLDGTKVLTIGG